MASGRVANVDLTQYKVAVWIKTDSFWVQPYADMTSVWVRPDGGYVLELRNVKKDGSLTAAYYNPRPIRVFRAEASGKDGTLSVFVELRDVNYPGSTYINSYILPAIGLKN